MPLAVTVFFPTVILVFVYLQELILVWPLPWQHLSSPLHQTCDATLNSKNKQNYKRSPIISFVEPPKHEELEAFDQFLTENHYLTVISSHKQILLNSHYAINIIIVSSQKLGNIGLGQVLKLQPHYPSPRVKIQHVIVFKTKAIVKVKICKDSIFFKFLSSRSFVKSRWLWVHLLDIFRLVKQ